MNRIKSQKGQALILIAFAIVGLVGFTALAIDTGRTFSDRRHAQNAADTASLAAALAKIRASDNPDMAARNAAAEAAALERAASNGYDNDGTDNTVEVHIPPISGEYSCANSPSTCDQYIQVVITSYLKTTFARVIGRTEMKNTVEAVARAEGTSSSTTGSSSDIFGTSAMVATKGGDYSQCFLMNGGAYLYTHNSGIYINCSHSQAIFLNGGADLNMDSNGQVVGCFATNGGANYDPITCDVNGGTSQTFDASYFSSVPTTQPPPTCSGNGSVSGNTYSPGNFTNITINSGNNVVMNPGVYCIGGSFNLNSGATLSGPNGRVQLVLQSQSILLNGGTTIDFNDLEIYGNNASFTLNGGAIFRADRLRYFSTGSGNFVVNGNSEVTSGNAYFYLHQGNITWNGNSILNLHAPPQGDPFGGLLIHKPFSNTSGITLNGGSDIHLTGTFMVPGSPVLFNGGVNFELHSQIIGYTFTVNGNTDADIYFVASENYAPPTPPDESSPGIELSE